MPLRLSRILLGIGLGAGLIVAVWYGGWVAPPESLSREVAAWTAVYPGPVREATVAPIECAPLRRLRIYLVCTEGCGEVRRLVLVKGLRATQLANLNRVQPEPVLETRRRFNAAVGREALRLDAGMAREMVACYLRMDGLDIGRVISDETAEGIAAARQDGEEVLERLASSLMTGNGVERIPIEATSQGFRSDLLYWDIDDAGKPVLTLRFDMARDGQVRNVRVGRLAAGEPAAPG